MGQVDWHIRAFIRDTYLGSNRIAFAVIALVASLLRRNIAISHTCSNQAIMFSEISIAASELEKESGLADNIGVGSPLSVMQ